IKSNAPSFVARTAVSMLACPEIITTIASTPFLRMRSSVSRPSIPSSHTSRSTRSTERASSMERHSSPEATATGSYPSSNRIDERASRIPCSSSTIKMELAMKVNSGKLTQARGRRGRCNLRHGQLKNEFRAGRQIVLDADRAVVLGHDAAGDRQAQARAAVLGRKMGQKQAVFILRRNSVPTVRYHDLDNFPVG